MISHPVSYKHVTYLLQRLILDVEFNLIEGSKDAHVFVFLFGLLTGRWFLRSSGSSWTMRWDICTAPHLTLCLEGSCSSTRQRTRRAPAVCNLPCNTAHTHRSHVELTLMKSPVAFFFFTLWDILWSFNVWICKRLLIVWCSFIFTLCNLFTLSFQMQRKQAQTTETLWMMESHRHWPGMTSSGSKSKVWRVRYIMNLAITYINKKISQCWQQVLGLFIKLWHCQYCIIFFFVIIIHDKPKPSVYVM